MSTKVGGFTTTALVPLIITLLIIPGMTGASSWVVGITPLIFLALFLLFGFGF